MLDTAERSTGRPEVITAFFYLSFLPPLGCSDQSATASQQLKRLSWLATDFSVDRDVYFPTNG